MTEQEAFLEAIREEPERTDHRLIFADWLEEREDPLGEFIRVQCERARMEEELRVYSEEQSYTAMKIREEALWDEHGEAWKELFGIDRQVRVSLGGLRQQEKGEVVMRRGTPERYILAHSTSYADIQDHIERVRSMPWISSLELHEPLLLPAFVRSRILLRMRELLIQRGGVSSAIPWNSLRPLHIPRVTHVTLEGGDRATNWNTLPSFARKKLHFLQIRENDHFGNDGARALASSGKLKELRALACRGCNMNVDGAEALLRSKAFPNLFVLGLEKNFINTRDMPYLERLRSKRKGELRVLLSPQL